LLSVGEQQRMAFARVLVHAPRIVILDEATSALDSGNESALYSRLRDTGATLISIAHRPAVLRHHTHVLHLLGDGAWRLHEAHAFRFEQAVAGMDRRRGDALAKVREAAVAL
jgi:putative ATP-binding cassette transporter